MCTRGPSAQDTGMGDRGSGRLRRQLKAKVTDSLAVRGVSTTGLWAARPKAKLTAEEEKRLERQRANKRRWARKERARSKKELEELKMMNDYLERLKRELKDDVDKMIQKKIHLKSVLINHECHKRRSGPITYVLCLPGSEQEGIPLSAKRARPAPQIAKDVAADSSAFSSNPNTVSLLDGKTQNKPHLKTDQRFEPIGGKHVIIHNGSIQSRVGDTAQNSQTIPSASATVPKTQTPGHQLSSLHEDHSYHSQPEESVQILTFQNGISTSDGSLETLPGSQTLLSGGFTVSDPATYGKSFMEMLQDNVTDTPTEIVNVPSASKTALFEMGPEDSQMVETAVNISSVFAVQSEEDVEVSTRQNDRRDICSEEENTETSVSGTSDSQNPKRKSSSRVLLLNPWAVEPAANAGQEAGQGSICYTSASTVGSSDHVLLTTDPDTATDYELFITTAAAESLPSCSEETTHNIEISYHLETANENAATSASVVVTDIGALTPVTVSCQDLSDKMEGLIFLSEFDSKSAKLSRGCSWQGDCALYKRPLSRVRCLSLPSSLSSAGVVPSTEDVVQIEVVEDQATAADTLEDYEGQQRLLSVIPSVVFAEEEEIRKEHEAGLRTSMRSDSSAQESLTTLISLEDVPSTPPTPYSPSSGPPFRDQVPGSSDDSGCRVKVEWVHGDRQLKSSWAFQCGVENATCSEEER